MHGGGLISHQVMMDDKSEMPMGSARHDASKPVPALVLRMRELQALMCKASQAEAKATKAEIDKLKYRVPNQYFVQAVDHALLLGIGEPLKRFQPHATSACASGRRDQILSV